MNRRAYLATGGVSIASFAGCTAWTNSNQLPVTGEGVRGEGDPVTIEKTIMDYLITYPEKSTKIRYVAYYSDDPQKYGLEPFK